MIRHHLKDGRILTDITGHVVKKEDVPAVYSLIDQINEEKRAKGKNEGIRE